MVVFFKTWPENIKEAFITLQTLRFTVNRVNQTCILLKSIMNLTRTGIFPNSAIFIEKKSAENWVWAKSKFLSAKKKKCTIDGFLNSDFDLFWSVYLKRGDITPQLLEKKWGSAAYLLRSFWCLETEVRVPASGHKSAVWVTPGTGP